MANRTVKVSLTAEVSQYVREMDRAERATDDLADELGDLSKKGDLDGLAVQAKETADGIDEVGASADKASGHVGKLDTEIRKAEQDLALLAGQFAETNDEAQRLDITKGVNKIEGQLRQLRKQRGVLAALIPPVAEAEKIGAEVGEAVAEGIADGMADGAKAVSEAVEEMSESTLTASKRVEKLDEEIVKAKRSLFALAGQFAQTSDAAKRLDLAKQISVAEAQLRRLSSNRNILMPPVADVAKTLSSRLLAAIPIVAPTLAPLLGGAIGGIVVGAVGAGGIVGGIALASRDPRVKAAGGALGKKMLGDLDKDAKVFVAPTLAVIDQVGDRFDTLRPRIRNIFANSAKLVQPFTESVLSGVDGLTDGIDSLIEKGGPAIIEFGHTIDTLLDSVGGAFDTMAGGSEEAAQALEDFTFVVGALIEGIGWLVRGLAEAWGVIHDTGTAIGEWLPPLRDTSNELGTFARHTAEAAYGAGEHADAMIAAEKAARGEKGALVELSIELRKQTDPVFALMRAQQDLKKAQTDVVEAQKEHGRNSPEYQEALRKAAEAALGLEAAAGAVADTSNGRMSPALRATLRAAKLTDQQIADLAKQFGIAEADALAFAAALNKIPRKVHTRIIVTRQGETIYAGGGGRQAPMMGSAAGGPVLGPGPKGVDSEPRLLAPGEHIWTAAEVDAAGGHGAMTQMRQSVLAGQGATAGAQGAMLMRPAGGTTTVVHVHRVALEGRGSLGTLLVNEIRNQTGTKAQLKELLGLSVS